MLCFMRWVEGGVFCCCWDVLCFISGLIRVWWICYDKKDEIVSCDVRGYCSCFWGNLFLVVFWRV